ncbi:MAG: hypothetical protein IPJ09_11305 [Saprospiraceae bacterium]|nr:hypothetical protein [Saprospiraceae bacterium]
MQCNSCKKSHLIDTKSSGLWGTLLLILLPKCPFCVLAYSSTIALCSASPDLSMNDDFHYAIWLVGISGVAIAISLIMKYKGSKTLIAMLVVGIGLLVTMMSILNRAAFIQYYTGVILITLGTWFNGSMFSFIKFIFQKFNLALDTNFILANKKSLK